MKPQSLYSIWLDAYNRNALPPEWALFIAFRGWAVANGYKAEYGYEGELTPDNLLSAMQNAQEITPGSVAKVFGVPEQILLQQSDDQLNSFMSINSPPHVSIDLENSPAGIGRDDQGNVHQRSESEKERLLNGEASINDIRAENGLNQIDDSMSDIKLKASSSDLMKESVMTGHLDAEDLVEKLTLADLQKLAADMGVDIGKEKTKRPIADLIAAVEVTFPVDEDGAFKGEEMPEWVKANPVIIGAELHLKEDA